MHRLLLLAPLLLASCATDPAPRAAAPVTTTEVAVAPAARGGTARVEPETAPVEGPVAPSPMLTTTIDTFTGTEAPGKVAQDFADGSEGLGACYEALRARSPDARGRLRLQADIDANGKVRASRVVGDTLADATFAACAEKVLRGIVFPKADRGTAVFEVGVEEIHLVGTTLGDPPPRREARPALKGDPGCKFPPDAHTDDEVVTVEVRVSEQGQASRITLLKAPSEAVFGVAAVECMTRATFEPGRDAAGNPIAAIGVFRVRFAR